MKKFLNKDIALEDEDDTFVSAMKLNQEFSDKIHENTFGDLVFVLFFGALAILF